MRILSKKDLRALVLFQCWRVIPGSMFLYYYYELGKLPFQFAVIGGIGDILVAVTAPFAAILAGKNSPAKLRALSVVEPSVETFQSSHQRS